jgi:hypothetical protein
LTSTNLLGYVTRTVLADSAAAIRAAAGGGSIGGSGTINRLAKFTASGTIGNGSIADSSSSVAMTISSAGNLGLGVTPSAWSTPTLSTKALQVGSVTSLFDIGVTYGTFLGYNYYNGEGIGDRYLQTGFASFYQQVSGQHRWFNAPSGTAGNAITFTQAMTLDASGNLGIGTTSPENIAGYKTITIDGSSGSIFTTTAGTKKSRFYTTTIGGYIGTVSNDFFAFITNDSERMRITSAGNLGIGTTTIGSKLQVNGNAAIGYSASTAAPTNGLAVAGNIDITGTSLLKITGNATNPNAADALYLWNEAGFGPNITGLKFAVNTGSTGATSKRFIIESNGNVGINTATIGSRLQVNGNAAIGYSASTAAPTNGLAVSGALAVGTNAELLSAASRGNITINGASTSILTFGVGAVAKAYFFHDNTHLTLANYTATGNIDFNTFSGADGTRMRLTNAGSLGIGTTTIGSTLQVNGNAAIGYSASTAGPTNGLSISGNTTIGTTTAAGKFTIDPDDNQVGLAITGTSLTSANEQSLIDLAQTWNTTGNPTAIKLNITNTASGATADLMELQVGGTSQFTVDKSGNTIMTGSVKTGAPTGGTAATWKLGSKISNTMAFDDSGYLEVEVGGTTYYVALCYPA